MQRLRRKAAAFICLGGISGKLGSVTSSAVRDAVAESECANGSSFHHLLLAQDMWVSAACSQFAIGQIQHTFAATPGHLKRIEFIA